MTSECIYERKPWPCDLLDVYQFDDTWTQLRLIGRTSSYYEYWLPVEREERTISLQKICGCYKPQGAKGMAPARIAELTLKANKC